MGETLRAVLWQGIFRPGAEWCELAARRTVGGWPARRWSLWRMIRFSCATPSRSPPIGRPARSRSTCAGLDARRGNCGLRVDAEQQWQIDREPHRIRSLPRRPSRVARSVDIDLGFTPATNTLPIRRLAPAIGETVDVTALWVRFPELTIEPLPQRYTRLDDSRYRYESAGGAFVAEIEVDDLGLVVTYEGGWQRIAEASAMG